MDKRRTSLRVFPHATGKSGGDGATYILLLILCEAKTCMVRKPNDIKQ
jgi:hypothetical protein